MTFWYVIKINFETLKLYEWASKLSPHTEHFGIHQESVEY